MRKGKRKTLREMRILRWSLIFLVLLMFAACGGRQDERAGSGDTGPLRLHPANPHYFLYRGKTMVLVSSAEHYGAVINLDFDYRKYLETLASEGMNYTRIFTGTYFEVPGESFHIEHNTLAPEKGRVVTPWRTIQGDDGKVRYDLSQWNDAYFRRLKDFLSLAREKGIIVEITLFSSVYTDRMWEICPENPANNINVDTPLVMSEVHILNNGNLFSYQAALVRKLVNELNGFDNFFFEIQNEPWSDHGVVVDDILNREDLSKDNWAMQVVFADTASMAWQDSIAAIIAAEEDKLPNRHLIAWNYANYGAPVPEVNEHISILNFHYAWPRVVRWNEHFGRVIGFDESGFAGSADRVYRRQAWKFMLSGGGLFNNLDYSFFVGHEDGTGVNHAPGGGSRELRRQLRVLRDFLESFPLERMHPDCDAVAASPGLIPYVLSDGNGVFAVYIKATGTRHSRLVLRTGAGTYRVTFLNPLTGRYSESRTCTARDGLLSIDVSVPEGETAIRVVPSGSSSGR